MWEDSESGVWSGVRKGAAKRRQTASALKGKRNSIVLPENKGVKMALMVPWMWCSGRVWRRWSEGEYSHACSSERACAVMTDWGSRTPFCTGWVSVCELGRRQEGTLYWSIGCARCVQHHSGRPGARLLQSDLLMDAAALELGQPEVCGFGIQLRLEHFIRLGSKLGRRQQHQGLAVVQDVLQFQRGERRRQWHGDGLGRENG